MIIDQRKVERIATHLQRGPTVCTTYYELNARMRHNAYVTNRKFTWIMRYAANLSISKTNKKSVKKSSLSLKKSVCAHVFTRHGC